MKLFPLLFCIVFLIMDFAYAEENNNLLSALDIEHVYTGEVFSNHSGGVFNKTGTEYRGNFDLTITLDSEQAELWHGTTFFLYFQDGHGKGITESYVGDLQYLSNIDAHEFSQISEYYIIQSMFNDRLRIKLGKQDANNDFNIAESAGEFINSSFGLMPNVPIPTFPHPSLGIAAFFDISENNILSIGFFDGKGKGSTSGFDTAFGTDPESSAILEYTIHHSPLSFLSQRGAMKLGFWRHGGKYQYISENRIRSSNHGGHLILDQGICGNPDHDGLCIDSFIQYGYSLGDCSEIPHYYGVGIRAQNVIPQRSDDSMGVGFIVADINNKCTGMDNESVIELYYCAAIKDSFTIQPDIQYIFNPGGIGTDAFVTGFRFGITF